MKQSDRKSVSMPDYVFFLPWELKPGTGVNNVVLGLSDAMRGRYTPVVVVTGACPPSDSEQIWLPLNDFSPPFKNEVAFGLYFGIQLFKLWRTTRNAIVANSHFAGLEMLPLAVLRRLRLCRKLMFTAHGSDVTDAKRAPRLKRALYAWMYAAADLVVACSSALAEEVRQVAPSANVISILNGVSSPPRFTSEPPTGASYLVCVAAFVEKKGHRTLLSAFKQIAGDHPALRLVLIGGDGPVRPEILSAIDTLGLKEHVDVFVNMPHDCVWHWIQNAECLILPSREEPFGIVLLEAALSRTPVVATRVGGIPEFLTDRVHGLLCEPDRPTELAAAVLETLANPEAAEQRTRSFEMRAREFTWSSVFEKYRAAADLP